MITVEEGAIGGFGEHVSRFLLGENLLGGGLKLKFSPMGLPDRCVLDEIGIYEVDSIPLHHLPLASCQ